MRGWRYSSRRLVGAGARNKTLTLLSRPDPDPALASRSPQPSDSSRANAEFAELHAKQITDTPVGHAAATAEGKDLSLSPSIDSKIARQARMADRAGDGKANAAFVEDDSLVAA